MPSHVQVAPEEADQSREELKALEYALSHDLEGSLRGIKGLTRILALKHGSDLNKEARDLMTLIDGEASRVSHLLAALLDWTRCGRQAPSWSWQDPAPIVQEVFAALTAACPERQIQLQLPDLPLVWSDRALLRRLFRELLANAIKFTAPRPLAVVTISSQEEPGETVITVRDNGVGFNIAHTAQLFGLFRRLHRQKEFVGDGAGLAVVRRIVGFHGGRVWAEAQVDQGAAFHFILPRPDPDLGLQR